MPWGVAAAAIGAAGAIGSSVIASNATSNATNSQIQGQQQATQQLAPFTNAGVNSLGALQNYIGVGANGSFNPGAPGVAPFSATAFQQSPGYQWQMGQGLQAINNQASAAGGVNGGNNLKALETYGQGLANQDYYNAANLYQTGQQNTLAALMGLTNVGQQAAGATAGISLQGGNTRSAGNIAQGQIGSNALTGLTSGINGNNLQSIYSSLFGNTNIPAGNSAGSISGVY